MLSLLAALNTGLSGNTLRRLTDTQWWALGALLSQWLDLHEGAESLAFTADLGELSRTEFVGAIILLLAAGHLRLEILLPPEVLSTDPLPEGAAFELGIHVVDPPPPEDVVETEELHELIRAKLPLLESAVASVTRSGYLQ